MKGATISIPYEEWEEVRQARLTVEAELADAKKRLAEVRRGDAGSDTRKLAEALEQLMPVAQFAIANCNPIATRGWPHEALGKFAALLPDLPVSEFLKEVATDLRVFAQTARDWEEARANGTAEEKLCEENAASITSPDGLPSSVQGAGILDAGKAMFDGDGR